MKNLFEKLLAILTAGGVALLAVPAAADPGDVMQPSFSVIGHIESLTLDTPGSLTSGAQITVSNIPVSIPANSLITMPGKYITPQDLFRGPTRTSFADPKPVLANTGLALMDPTPPKISFEAEIIGNIDNATGRLNAVNVHISQGALHTGAGFVQSINYVTGELRVGARGGSKGARVRLNDVEGVYGKKNSERTDVPVDERFELDSGNSPVHAKTGYPVCIPRTDPAISDDPLCPKANRPAPSPANATLHMRFTCGTVAAAPDVQAHSACNPNLPAPLQVGDYVTYLGVLTVDPTVPAGGNPYIMATYGLDAELGIYTSPGAEPVYVLIEEGLQGTKGEPFRTDPVFGDIPQEETTRFRVVGFTTDPSRNVEIGIFNSGRPTFARHSFTGPGGLRPSNLAQLGRFRFTWPSKDAARAVRRDVFASVVGSPHDIVTPQGFLTSGSYEAPVAEYIYPEGTSFGWPGFATPVPVENFCFLTDTNPANQTVFETESESAPNVAIPATLEAMVPMPFSGHALSEPIAGGRACDGQ